jgi:hypothetical protein
VKLLLDNHAAIDSEAYFAAMKIGHRGILELLFEKSPMNTNPCPIS